MLPYQPVMQCALPSPLVHVAVGKISELQLSFQKNSCSSKTLHNYAQFATFQKMTLVGSSTLGINIFLSQFI